MLLMLVSVSGCAFVQQAQEGDIVGRYRCITDFSRDIISMRGSKHTVVYKNGRQETIRFLADHTFSRKVHFTNDRVKDEKMVGTWKLAGGQLVEVWPRHKNNPGSANTPAIEYYQFEKQQGTLVRLKANKEMLASEYAAYYTFYRL